MGLGALALMLAVAGPLGAQGKAPAAAAQGGQQVPGITDPYRLNMLIRTTLIALSQANLTGNYTVLRDLGSPDFQATNSAAKLTDAFGDLRRRGLDFSPILFFDPKLVRQPALDDAGRLRLRGFFETRPEQINFDMLFQNVGGSWRLFGLAVQMQPAPAETASPAPQAAPAQKTGATPPKDKRASQAATPAKQ